jgi:tRNA-specific 2-thiouridylase
MRCLALFSGGLDSMIAVSLLKKQGVEVIALFMDTGFGSSDDNVAILQKRASIAGAALEIIDIKEQFIQEILFDPKYGYGKQFNPCIDCHGNMFKIALALLEKYDAQFIITGEVKGQRPMSQRADALRIVEKLALDEHHLILRPLSALSLSPTTPELEGWVDREQLWGIVGRSRDKQLGYAKEMGWEDYQSPGGGCLLTEEGYAKKIKDFIAHDTFMSQDIAVLKVGRHMRLSSGAKLVVSRNQQENEKIEKLHNDRYILLKAIDIAGPLALLDKDANKSDRDLAAKIVLTYTKWDVDTIGKVDVGGDKSEAYPFENRSQAQEYLV